MTTALLEPGVGATVCLVCRVNPRGAAGRLSRCLPCLKALVEADRKQREKLKARAAARAIEKRRLARQAAADRALEGEMTVPRFSSEQWRAA